MSRVPKATHSLAVHLHAIETKALKNSQSDLVAASRVCEKLRPALTQLAGPVGYASLLSRALALTKSTNPALQALRVGDDGIVAGYDDFEQHARFQDACQELKAGQLLVAHLLGLLITFIGEPLTMSLLREAWPDESFGKAD